MLASVDPFLSRRRRRGYDCRHFVREVWLAHAGEDIGERLPALMGDPVTLCKSEVAGFHRLNGREDPCLVVFRRPGQSHVGVFLRGGVLHLGERAARFERIDTVMIGFSGVRFYR